MRGSEGGRVVLNSRGGEYLASAGGIKRVHFVGRAGQGADLAGAPEAPKRSEGGIPPTSGPFFLVLGGLGIDEVNGDGLNAKLLNIGEAGYGAGGVVVVRRVGIARIRSVDAFVESREDLGGLEGGHIEEAAPDFGGGEAAGREACDDSEVVGAAFESAPEVGVG